MSRIPFYTLLVILLPLLSWGQVVNEVVRFDTYLSASDNDFQNRFDNGAGLNQIQVNGITGGCLETPQTISWGNDNAVYCTRFKGVIGNSYHVSISFRYDTAQLNNINFDRAASLWMRPFADFNHYVIASVLDTRRIQIVSYSASSTSAVMQLQQGHWYNLILTTVFTGGAFNDQIDINSQVNDLGISGTDPPIPAGFTNTVLHDSVMIADTAIELSVTGTLWGGALYLDDFQIVGMKSYDNCISTGIDAVPVEIDFIFLAEGNLLTVFPGVNLLYSNISVFNLSGQKVIEGKLREATSGFDISSLASGFYLLSVENEKGRITKKFSRIRN